MKRYGLALSGGAAKGAFIVGALQWLQEEKGLDKFEVISGTSTGSLVGTLVTLRDYDNLIYIYTAVETAMLVNPFFPLIAELGGPQAALAATAIGKEGSIFSTEGMERVIDDYIPDFKEVMDKAPETELIYNTVDMQSGEAVYFSSRKHSAEQMRAALVASANQPVLMPLVPIETVVNGQKITHQYADGGVRDHTPLKAVFASEASPAIDRLLVVTVSPLKKDVEAAKAPGKELKVTTEILLRTIEMFGKDVFENDIRTANLYNCLLQVKDALGPGEWARVVETMPSSIREGTRLEGLADKKAVEIIYIAPEEDLAIDNLNFDKDEMNEARVIGRRRAEAVFADIEP